MMNDHQFFSRWQNIKQKGRLRYALSYGLKYGVFLTVFTNLLKLNQFTFSEIFIRPSILFEWLIFTIFGIVFFATFMWWLNNYFYTKRK